MGEIGKLKVVERGITSVNYIKCINKKEGFGVMVLRTKKKPTQF